MKKILICILITVFCMNLTVFAYDTADLAEKISELKGLMAECTEIGLECPYEEMKITVMEQFADGEDISEPEIAKARLDEIYAETKTALTQYINGEKEPLSVPKYVTSDIEIKGRNMYANTTQGKRPVFFVGYGHFDEAVEAFGDFSKLGANITQQQVGPWDVIYEAANPYGWSRYWAGYERNATSANYDSANVYAGDVSLKLDLTADVANTSYSGIRQELTLEPNTSYTLTFRGKATGSGARVTPFTGAGAVTLATSTIWRSYSVKFTTGETVTGNIQIDGARGGISYIDNIKLVKDGESENLVKNGNFEENANPFGNNNEYIVSTDYIENKIIPMLDRAAQYNVAVDILLSPHYFPTFINGIYYQDVNIYHEQNRIVLDKYIDTLIPMIKDHPALASVCLSNEPAATTSTIGGFDEEYRNYLLGKYSSLEGINNAWGTNYTAVTDIAMPTEPGTTREFYDWMEYNDTKYADWHAHLADKVREHMPEAKIHSKMQDYHCQDSSMDFERGRMMWGTDAEKFAEFSDLAGNDSYANWQWKAELSNGRPISGKLKWYDFIASIYDAPVFNSEDHVIQDNSTDYDPLIAHHVGADVFQGAFHGRAASALWSWVKTADETSIYQGNAMQRPDVMTKIGKATLDLNRLSYEVAAFNDKQADVAVYYSNIERAYNVHHLTILDRVHDACLISGQKVEFVTDNSINDIKDCDVLIIPYADHVPASTRNAVKEFKDSGKKVILAGNCLSYDEYDKSVTFDKTGYSQYTTSFDRVTLAEEIYASVQNGYTLKLCDASGNIVSGLEWNYVPYNGRMLVNLCNYNESNLENLKVVYNGEAMAVTDLISNESKSTSFTVEPYESMLLAFDLESNTEISQCYIENAKVKVTVKNKGELAENISIVAEYYDADWTMRKWGSVGRTVDAGAEAKAEFYFGAAGGPVVVKLTDASGTVLNEKVFE